MRDLQLAFVQDPDAAVAGSMNDATANVGPEDSPSGESDEALMTAFAGGSAAAFSQLFARYRQPLFGFFRRRVADRAQAEELAQEVFVAVVRGATRYRPGALFRTYLYAVGFRILRSYRRKAAFRATFLGSSEEFREPAAQDSTNTDLMMRLALKKLEPAEAEILLLREFEQLSYAEIAELLGLPLNTVRTRLFRARVALRGLLAHAPKNIRAGFTEAAGLTEAKELP